MHFSWKWNIRRWENYVIQNDISIIEAKIKFTFSGNGTIVKSAIDQWILDATAQNWAFLYCWPILISVITIQYMLEILKSSLMRLGYNINQSELFIICIIFFTNLYPFSILPIHIWNVVSIWLWIQLIRSRRQDDQKWWRV